MAGLGVAPRRQTADFLAQHDVRIDGEKITELNYAVDANKIPLLNLTIDGKRIAMEFHSDKVLLFHKPTGVVSSHRTQKIRGKELKTIYDFLPVKYKTWFFAGRLDISSSGLMVLSNDGDHIFQLSHPKFGALKKYFVRTSRPLSNDEIIKIQKGVFDKGEKLRFEKCIALDKPAHYEIHLKEGKNREIRRVLEKVGVFARELRRTELGPYALETIPVGGFLLTEKK